MLILAIETSCDETAAAVTNGRKVLSSVINTQIEEHKVYGGVVPEIASRRHCENISSVVLEAVRQAGITFRDLDAVAVSFAPGLIGALLVGVNFAKGLAMSLGIPLIPVHHLRSHIAANYITNIDLKPPFLCLTVSGGNTLITAVNAYTDFEIIGATRDDAAGECFDKVARALGLSYPGGVNLDKIASVADLTKYPMPKPRVEGSDYDFSFSGLKTAVINIIHNLIQKGEAPDTPVLAATVRKRVCDMLIENNLLAAEKCGFKRLALAGGVSANSELRSRMEEACAQRGIELYLPELKYCGDNAAMVGVQAYYEYLDGNTADAELNAFATLSIDYNK
ncbi:MAG: tRNA (adenosine(37)-N6)-threonylcarbamoyltransferase complex transferase subunit TsaD [Clostridia bacterium]|nr:tRNA (adenosine(37)-N6)-threonylcarbamoyltransferase complex transferase subunit TsaD [Clostridia bacterium]